MDYELEKAVRLRDKGEFESLYGYYFEELDLKTKQVSPHYVGWAYDLYFDVTELVVMRILEFNKEETSTVDQIIRGKLQPDKSDRRAAASYSFLGTDRLIEDFSIRIVRSSGDQDTVEIDGSPAFEAEWDFQTKTWPDFLQVGVVLSGNKFDLLADFVEKGGSKARIRLGLVHGFYSLWSPSIRTDTIKVLKSIEDQKVKREVSDDISPRVLGKVGRFDFSLIRGETAQPVVQDNSTPVAVAPAFLADNPTPTIDLHRLETLVQRLLTPLWLAVGAIIAGIIFG